MFFGGLIMLLVVLVCAAALVALWAAALRRPRGGALPACGRCGYAVKGLTALSCPECGGDLREVGITTPRSRQKLTPLVFVMLWTLLLPIPVLAISWVVAATIGPTETRLTQSFHLLHAQSFSQPNVPGIDAHFEMQVLHWNGSRLSRSNSMSAGMGPGGTFRTTLSVPVAKGRSNLTLSLLQNPQPSASAGQAGATSSGNLQLNLTRDTGHYEHAGSTITVSVPPTEQELVDWFKANAVQAPDAELRADAAELAALVQAIDTGTGSATFTRYRSGGGSSSSSSGPAAWFGWMLLLFWLAVYAGGVVLYYRLRRRRIAAANRNALDPNPSTDKAPAP